jgi:response regulator RpfG family c-di-GMP phosphodiesterase
MQDRVRVLFVDDDELVLAALRRLFAKEPYELFFANNGRLALQLVAQKRIDIAVCDHRMPGMTGVEFFEALFQKHRNIMRVMLSGVGAPPAPPPSSKPDAPPPPPLDWATKSKLNTAKTQLKNHAYNEGQVHRFIEKPWNDAELKAVVADMAAIVRSTRRRPSA